MKVPFEKFVITPSKYSIGEFTVGVFPTAHCDSSQLAGDAKDLHERQQEFIRTAIILELERRQQEHL